MIGALLLVALSQAAPSYLPQLVWNPRSGEFIYDGGAGSIPPSGVEAVYAPWYFGGLPDAGSSGGGGNVVDGGGPYDLVGLNVGDAGLNTNSDVCYTAATGGIQCLSDAGASAVAPSYIGTGLQVDGGLFVAQTINADAGLNVNGNETVGGTLAVTGTSALTGTVYEASGAFVDGGLFCAQTINADAGLNVNGNEVVNGTTTLKGNTYAAAGLQVDGGATLNGDVCTNVLTGSSGPVMCLSDAGGVGNPYTGSFVDKGTFIADAGNFDGVTVATSVGFGGPVIQNDGSGNILIDASSTHNIYMGYYNGKVIVNQNGGFGLVIGGSGTVYTISTAGQCSLSTGTCTVSDSSIASTSVVVCSCVGGTVSGCNVSYSAGTSFTLTCASADTKANWFRVN